MELRLASRPHRRAIVEPKENGRSYKGFEVYQALDLVLPSIQPQVLRSPKGKGV